LAVTAPAGAAALDAELVELALFAMEPFDLLVELLVVVVVPLGVAVALLVVVVVIEPLGVDLVVVAVLLLVAADVVSLAGHLT
jgi:hypothetical protein